MGTVSVRERPETICGTAAPDEKYQPFQDLCHGGLVEGYVRVMAILYFVTNSPKPLCLPHVISILYAGVWINLTCTKGMSPIESHAFLFEAQEKYIKLILA